MNLDTLSVGLEHLNKLQALQQLTQEHDSSVIVKLTAVFGIFVVPFIAIVLVMWFIFSYKHKQNKLKAGLMTKAIENGQIIPDNFFEKKKKKRSPLQTGIIWVAVGLGISVFLLIAAQKIQPVGLGIIPLFIGIGYLFIHFFDKKQAVKAENDSDK